VHFTVHQLVPTKETEMTTQSPSRSIVVGYDGSPASRASAAGGPTLAEDLGMVRGTSDELLAEASDAEPVHTDGDIRRIGVAYDGSPEADAALGAADSLASDLSAALTVYCLVGSTSIPVSEAIGENARSAPSAAVSTATRRFRPETQLLLGVPAEEIAGRAYGVVDLLFVHRALLNNVSGALVRAAGCPVVVS
jgi:nucleotide-binding universal stress UspA family protein